MTAAVPLNARKGPPCVAGTVLGRASTETRTELVAAMLDPLCSSAAIAAALSEATGVPVSTVSLNRHRRTVRGRFGGCACHG